jgi:hypothetical protein
MIRLATACRYTSDSSASTQASRNKKALVCERFVDLAPPGPSTKACGLPVRSEFDLVQGAQNNGHAAVNIIRAWDGVVAARLDRKRARICDEKLHAFGYIFGRCGLENAARREDAGIGPALIVELSVGRLVAEKDFAGEFRFEALALCRDDLY